MQTIDTQASDVRVAQPVRIEGDGYVGLRVPGDAGVVRAWVQQDICLAALRQCIAAPAPVLVRRLGVDLWVITGLLHAPTAVAAAAEADAPVVLRGDSLELGDGAARFWVEGRTLHCRAFHMNFRADGQQRLVGATIALG